MQTAIDQKADKTTVAENTAAIESNKAAIAQEKKDRDHADQKLQDQITINKGQIENEATNRANEDKRIEAKFDGEVSRCYIMGIIKLLIMRGAKNALH